MTKHFQTSRRLCNKKCRMTMLATRFDWDSTYDVFYLWFIQINQSRLKPEILSTLQTIEAYLELTRFINSGVVDIIPNAQLLEGHNIHFFPQYLWKVGLQLCKTSDWNRVIKTTYGHLHLQHFNHIVEEKFS